MTSTGADLTVIATAPSEFAAHHLASLLDDDGIEAIVQRPRSVGPSLARDMTTADVLVARADAERARAALAAHREASADVDWDEVDLGERGDDLPLTPRGRRPWALRAAFAAIVVLVLGTLGALVVATFLS